MIIVSLKKSGFRGKFKIQRIKWKMETERITICGYSKYSSNREVYSCKYLHWKNRKIIRSQIT
jgi:hypothetical protein